MCLLRLLLINWNNVIVMVVYEVMKILYIMISIGMWFLNLRCMI